VMVHLGDITKINGAEIEPVDVIVGGSPYQDLSVAGKRAGLAGERSGLFMEQIRIVKEMRERYGADKPRFMVWENVPGAFSSNSGEDFRVVLEETARVADSNAVIPRPPGGKWATAGTVMGDGWSIAWRVLDARFWGVPQRRRRIALVADFGGQSAPEILFERCGVSGDIAESGAEREGAAEGAERGIGAAGFKLGNSEDARSIGWQDECAPTLNAECGGNKPAVVTYCLQGNGIDRADLEETVRIAGDVEGGVGKAICYGISSYESNAMKSANPHSGIYEAETARTLDLNGNPACNQGGIMICFEPRPQDGVPRISGDVVPTLNTAQGGQRQPCIATYQEPFSVDCRNLSISKQHGTLQAKENGGQSLNYMGAVATHSIETYHCETHEETASTLKARDWKDPQCISDNGYSVRRLTPLECERLQGFPDGWTDIGEYIDNGKRKQSSDSARYKALGNSIALPPWRFVMSRICRVIGRKATLGSLFDGIGGFPLIWEEINGKGSARWASEIEPFPIAVTKFRFGED
jgi:DNA (cytosine-5)-methyltransferase 1